VSRTGWQRRRTFNAATRLLERAGPGQNANST
jgi:hypothetical protein